MYITFLKESLFSVWARVSGISAPDMRNVRICAAKFIIQWQRHRSAWPPGGPPSLRILVIYALNDPREPGQRK